MVNIGFYGKLCRSGPYHQQDVAEEFAASKLAWAQLQRGDYYDRPWYFDIPAAAGKRIILRTWFWWEIPQVDKDWTGLYLNPASLDLALEIMCQQIDFAGPENLHGLTINEEEPRIGYVFTESPRPVNIDHYIAVQNILYDALKARYPRLKIIAEAHPLDWFTDDEVMQLKMDGFMAYNYHSQLSHPGEHLAYVQRAASIAARKGLGKEVYTLSFAACTPAAWSQPNGDPSLIRAAFEECVAAGIPNIGFFSYFTGLPPSEECIMWNDYEPNGVDPKEDPYLHKQAMLELIEQYAEVPPPERGWAIPDFIMNAIFIMLMMTVVKKAL